MEVDRRFSVSSFDKVSKWLMRFRTLDLGTNSCGGVALLALEEVLDVRWLLCNSESTSCNPLGPGSACMPLGPGSCNPLGPGSACTPLGPGSPFEELPQFSQHIIFSNMDNCMYRQERRICNQHEVSSSLPHVAEGRGTLHHYLPQQAASWQLQKYMGQLSLG